ncbi:MAG: DUF2188 domain-containing protein [Nitrospira sp.]|nr:DUF2188 domain-containing protein [Nitrospira sp.]
MFRWLETLPRHAQETGRSKVRGNSRASGVHENKADTVDQAKNPAKSKPLGQVIIHRHDGKIQAEHTHGSDPYPPKG